MSAIWGFISFEDDKVKLKDRTDSCRSRMQEPYRECAIDRVEEISFGNGFFACGIQYFTKEAVSEKLPIRDEKRRLVFTGDIILNAREELIKELKSELSETAITELADVVLKEKAPATPDLLERWPDGALSYAAYILWGKSFVDHIQGLFAIAVYDIGSGRFSLFTDHMGCRCIYYSVCGKELFFSSLCRPIIDSMPSEYFGISEKFIAGAEYSSTPAMLLFPGLSPFENVYQLVRGHYLEAEAANGEFEAKVAEYYNPARNAIQRMKLQIPDDNPDRYFRQIFRNTFNECVSDAIRCKGNVAATISSGLDSTSVAGVAASILDLRNEKLYGFTSVPLKDYVNNLDEGDVPDESEGVKLFCAGYNNIEPSFIRCEGKSAFTEMDELIHRFEVPGKAIINQVWMVEIARMMKEKDCTVMLNGQYGNFTLSCGNAFSRTFQELYAGNFKEAKRQIAAFGKRYNVPRKVLLSSLIDTVLTKILFDIGLDKSYNDSFDKKYLKKELLRKYKIKSTEKKLYHKHGYTFCEPRCKQDNLIMDEIFLGTMGIFDTKISMYYGVLYRDPTRDKRMVDLCMALPNSCFTDDGLERRLVRAYLDDVVPDAIRNDPGHRGVQSADAVLRLQRFGTDRRFTELDSKVFYYLEKENVNKVMEQEITEENHSDIVRILSLDKFLKEFGRL